MNAQAKHSRRSSRGEPKDICEIRIERHQQSPPLDCEQSNNLIMGAAQAGLDY
jgi:hypothetical protein